MHYACNSENYEFIIRLTREERGEKKFIPLSFIKGATAGDVVTLNVTIAVFSTQKKVGRKGKKLEKEE